VAGAAQRHQLIEVEIGAALRPLDDMMDIKPATPAAGFAAPPSSTFGFVFAFFFSFRRRVCAAVDRLSRMVMIRAAALFNARPWQWPR
jgi:hypothetical protein